MSTSTRLSRYLPLLEDIEPIKAKGFVEQVVGLIIQGRGPAASIGDMCDIYPRFSCAAIKAEVVGFKDQSVLLMPLGDMRGVHPGSLIINRGEKATIVGTPALRGRVLDGLGQPLDQKGALPDGEPYPLYAEPLNPLRKQRIGVPLDMGIRAINGVLTCGKGQRLGIFAGSGVGKSVLLGMMARHTQADVNVIALIGERGREVREFLERDLGEEGLQKSVVVVATSDQAPLIRMRGAYVATASPIFSCSRPGCPVADGFPDALCHGATRGGIISGGATTHQRLHAVGIRLAPEASRTDRQCQGYREYHRLLYRAR